MIGKSLNTSKVIYVCYEPLTARVERDWYIDYLITKGILVEYWDCSQIFYGKREFVDSLEKHYVVKIKNYNHLESLLKKEENLNASYIICIVYEYKALKLYRLLTHYKCRLYFIKWAVFPHKNRIISKLLSHPFKLTVRVFDKIITLTSKKIGMVKPFEKIFYAGSAALSFARDTTKNIPISMCDFDNFLLSKDHSNELSGKNYSVFLDINLPFHPDLYLINSRYITPEKYFDSLNNFFELVEKKFGVDVVVAGHPSSNYQENTFNGRKILKYVTPVLVRDAQFVISHHSASMNFAVLNKIPIIFIYTDEMERIYRDSIMTVIRGSAEFLCAALYNIDVVKGTDEITINEVDEERYDLYKYNFLTSEESEGLLSREIFFREIISD